MATSLRERALIAQIMTAHSAARQEHEAEQRRRRRKNVAHNLNCARHDFGWNLAVHVSMSRSTLHTEAT